MLCRSICQFFKQRLFSSKENMLYQPEYSDVQTLRRIVSAFENSGVWTNLTPIGLDEGVSIRIGTDSPIEEIEDVSMATLKQMCLKVYFSNWTNTYTL